RYAFEPNTLKSQEMWSITQQSVRNPDQQAPSSREYAMSFARLFAGVASPILAERHGSPKRSFRLRSGPSAALCARFRMPPSFGGRSYVHGVDYSAGRYGGRHS